MKADLSKVPFDADELDAVAAVTQVVDEVLAQAGIDDEEPGIDADDIGQILINSFAPGSAAARYVAGGGSPRGMINRIKNVFYGVERAYGLAAGSTE